MSTPLKVAALLIACSGTVFTQGDGRVAGRLTDEARKATAQYEQKRRKSKRRYLSSLLAEDDKLVKSLERALSSARKKDGVAFADLQRIQNEISSAKRRREEHRSALEELTHKSPDLARVKDDQLEHWAVGAKFKGTRLPRHAKDSVEGTVTVSNRERLVVATLEHWRGKKRGRRISQRGTWVFKRVKHDPRTGKVWLKLVDCERPKGPKRTLIFNEAGDVTIAGHVLSGDYRYDWKRGDNGEVQDGRHPLRLRLTK